MNNWTCSKCNAENSDSQKFCGSCGQPRGESASNSMPDLPPTIMAGYVPQPAAPPLSVSQPNPQSQNQSNFQSSQQQNQNQYQQPPPNQFQQQSPPIQQFQTPTPYSTTAPKKSNSKTLLIVGGVVGLLLVSVIGIVVFAAVLSPYLKEQARIKKEVDNQSRANNFAAVSLIPSSFVNYSTSPAQTYNNVRLYNKMELLQASQNLPPELKDGINDITDAGAADFANSANTYQKTSLQVFKFNSPEKAAAKCEQISQAFNKKRENFKEVTINYFDSKYPSVCSTSAETKTGEVVFIKTRYGFLLASLGKEKTAVSAALNTPSNMLNP